MSFPRYYEYKDSGVECLGLIPTPWEIVRVKRVGSLRYGIGEPPKYHEAGTPFIRATNVHAGSLYSDGLVYVDPAEIPTQRIVWLATGDIIVVRSGAYTGDSAIIPPEFGPCIAGFDMVLRCQSARPEFVQYALLSKYLKEGQIDVEKMRAAQPHLNAEELGSCLLALPSMKEQDAIVSFLDRETAKIDELVAEQQRLVGLLKEKREAVISHAVTKGLNPDAPMKPSGVEWLGEVPTYWEIKKLKHVSPELTVGIVIEPSKLYVEEGVPALRSLNIKAGKVSLDNMVFISQAGHETHSKSKLRAGDIVAVRTGQPGASAVIPRELDGCNCIDLIVIRKPNIGSERFLYWYLGSDSALGQFEIGSGGAIQQHFNISTAAELIIPVPPSDDQFRIAAFLDAATEQFDALTAEAQRAIELLQERRTALISAAVTGQIDVRAIAGRAAA
ncbi:restriction endonuclease subunit S [Corallococcus exiguus]|uniref:restriction endonuclease subunit S n=1 Tax=Corallococcus exiguus TaxID=83462 RepID=UPI003DA3553D